MLYKEPRTPARRLTLNPFAFPSDTDFRFILLIVSMLGTSLFIYSAVYFTIPATRDYWLNLNLQCLKLRPVPTSQEDYTNPAIQAAQAAYEQCRAPAERSNAAWIVGGACLLLILAGLIYWIYPSIKIRREKLEPLSPDDAPEVVDYLTKLCRVMKLSQPPIFLWNPLNTSSGGLAFGRLGRYYVSLTGGLVTQFYTDLPAFRAVVLHELAHLRNADVDKTYFAVAVWRAFLIAALLPFLGTIFENGWGYVVSVSWRVAALAALVYLMRNAVLRTREIYADVRASLWDGSTSALTHVLESLSTPKMSRWRSLLQVHPDPGHRRQMLEDPGRLLPMGFWDAAATGIAAAVALPNVVTLMTSLLTGTSLSALGSLVAVLVVAPLVVGVVGLGAWRTTFAALERGKARRDAGRLGFALGIGILLGVILSFKSLILVGTTEVFSAADLVFNIAWGILLLVSLFFFLRWIATGASAWLEVIVANQSPRHFYTLGLVIAGGVLAIWLGFLFYIRTLGFTAVFLMISPLDAFGFIVQQPLTLVGLVSLWAFPMAAWLSPRRTGSTSGSNWAFLGATAKEPILMRKTSFRPGLALTIALMSGLMYCAFLLLARIGLRIIVSETVRDTDQYRYMFYLIQIAVAVLFQAGVAALVTAWVPRLEAVHGLFAAFVSGCVMTFGLLALNVLFGGTLNIQFVWDTFSQIVNEGALLSILVVWGVSALSKFVRRMRGRPPLISPEQMA